MPSVIYCSARASVDPTPCRSKLCGLHDRWWSCTPFLSAHQVGAHGEVCPSWRPRHRRHTVLGPQVTQLGHLR
eukprot:23056-Eustigmatos_ZCMA.PRE.1